jgi:hypothetical protein
LEDSGADMPSSSFLWQGIKTGKMGVLGGVAAQNTHFSGIFPFPLEGEGVRGWGWGGITSSGKA